jgi:hypothetical protein
MNLPGMHSYDPALPWLSKIRLTDGTIAAGLFVYVDDVRITGATTKDDCWAARRQGESIFNSLGIQEWPSRRPGAWGGVDCGNYCPRCVRSGAA